jgi:hypothetical protein
VALQTGARDAFFLIPLEFCDLGRWFGDFDKNGAKF